MEGAFEYIPVTSGSQAFDDAEQINREAFPPESYTPMAELVSRQEKVPGSKVIAVYEQEACVGFFHIIEMETFVYGAFFAVSAEKRGQGYGSKILQAMLENCNGKPFIGEVEYPFEDATNYEQRVKRIRFYERNNVPNTGETIEFKGHGTFYLISSVPNAPLQDYLAFVEPSGLVITHSF